MREAKFYINTTVSLHKIQTTWIPQYTVDIKIPPVSTHRNGYSIRCSTSENTPQTARNADFPKCGSKRPCYPPRFGGYITRSAPKNGCRGWLSKRRVRAAVFRLEREVKRRWIATRLRFFPSSASHTGQRSRACSAPQSTPPWREWCRSVLFCCSLWVLWCLYQASEGGGRLIERFSFRGIGGSSRPTVGRLQYGSCVRLNHDSRYEMSVPRGRQPQRSGENPLGLTIRPPNLNQARLSENRPRMSAY